MKYLHLFVFVSILVLSTAVPAYAETPINLRISNVTDAAFSVSWVNNAAEAGYLFYGSDPGALSRRAEDDRGVGVTGTTHHVTILNLLAATTYYFDVYSGGTVDNNSGAHYRVTAGPLVNPGAPFAVYGRIARADGSSPAGVIYYLTLRDGDGQGAGGSAALMSGIIKESDQGYWSLNLGNARLENLSGPFVYSPSGDKLDLRFVGGPNQVQEVTLDTGAAAPAAQVTLAAAGGPPTASPTAPAQPTPAVTPTAPDVTPTVPAPTSTPAPGSTATPTPVRVSTVTPTGASTPSGATTPTLPATPLASATQAVPTPTPPAGQATPAILASPTVAGTASAQATPTAPVIRPTPTAVTAQAAPTPVPAQATRPVPTIPPPASSGGNTEEWLGWGLIIVGGGLLLGMGLLIRLLVRRK